MLNKFVAVGVTLAGLAGIIVPALAVGGHFDAAWLADPNALWSIRVWGKLHYAPNAPTLLNYAISIAGVYCFIVGMCKCEGEWPSSPLFR